ncbi:hypothetical protein BJX61DRAFT_530263 [Aspergillus egyptiacus]|nr:hypothetical protein BJX61DRAFT_530263 [Aspergillus egyptiacus]
MPEFPCGGLPPSNDRTQVSLSSPSFPIALEMGHDQTAVEILLGLGTNPGTNYNVTLRKTFRIEGLGAFCVPAIHLSEEVLGTKLTDGLNFTVQVVTNGHPSGGLYACADFQLTTASVPSPTANDCFNNTGVSGTYFTGAAADRHANASTADGQPQGSDSDHGHGHDQGGNGTASETDSAEETTPTDAATALQTAAWGVLGAAVVAGFAVL